jgi:hypothetical protein
MLFQPKEFLVYIIRPTYIQEHRKSSNLFITVIQLYLLLLLFAGLTSFIISITINSFIEFPKDTVLCLPREFDGQLMKLFIYAGILVPVVEETIFRLPLKIKPIYISISASLLIATVTFKIIGNIVMTIGAVTFVFLSVYLVFVHHSEYLKKFWMNNFTIIYLISSLTFGLIHSMNFDYDQLWQYFLIPILVFPQLVIGFYFGFIRMYYKNGFLICILIHALTNSISFYFILKL